MHNKKDCFAFSISWSYICIKIYPVSKNGIMSLTLKNFSKSICYQYAEGLKNESFYSSIIINNVSINCHILR